MSAPRRRARLAVALAALLLAAPVALHAQQAAPAARQPGDTTGARAIAAPQPEVITFQEAVDLAMDRNASLHRARADVGLRDVIETRQWMDFLPDLSLSTRMRRSFGRSFSQEQGAILSETNDFFDAGVSAGLDLFDGFERVASLREASLREDASRLRLRRTEQDVLFQVVQGFTELLLARELVEVREQELTAADELLAQVRRLVEVGRQPVSDAYQQEAVQAEAEAALVEARRQVELTETGLMQVLLLDPLGEYEFRTDALEPADSVPVDDAYVLERLLETAFHRRADLAAADAALEASDQGVRAAQSGYWPTLGVSFSYGSNWASNSLQAVPGTGSDPRTVTVTPDDGGEPVTITVPGSGEDPDFFRPGFTDQLDARRGGAIALSLSVPIFDRFQVRTEVEQAQVERMNALYDAREQRQQVALEVRQALLDYRSAVAQLRATTRRLDAAERAWRAAERRYELGAATFVEVAQARSTLASARSAVARSRSTVLLTRRLIDYYTGTLDPEVVTRDAPAGGSG